MQERYDNRSTGKVCGQHLFVHLIPIAVWLVISPAFAASPTAISPRTPRISPLIDQADPGQVLKVWVLFTDKGALDWDEARLSDRAKRRRAYRAHSSQPDITDLPVNARYVEAVLRTGGRLRSKSRWLNGIGLEATIAEIRAIAYLPFVRAIDPILEYTERIERAQPSAPPAIEGLDYGNASGQITQIQGDFLHQEGFLGEGMVIGVLDSGFNLTHTALQRVDVIAQHDFVNNDDNTADEIGQDDFDQDDHGSIVLGILAGNAPGQLMGIAYRASYLLAKTEKGSENGREFEQPIEEDWWVEGLEWLEEMGADVVNSSIGYSAWYRFQDLDGKTSKLTIAANLAIKKGMPVVVAAGNFGDQPLGDLGLPGRINPPADGFDVLAIGAVSRSGRASRFSAHGPTFDGRIKPDLMAMGESVTSINPLTRSGFLNNYRGTSVSAPLAAGVVTLLLQAFPLATPQDIVDALRTTASQSDKPDNTAGYGIINARAAYEVLLDQFGQTGIPDPIAVQPHTDRLPITLGALKQGVLFQNYPNPFNAETWMPFKLAFPGPVAIRIYDIHGTLIKTLQLGDLPAGNYASKQRAAYWDGKNLRGERAASGLYFYVLEFLGETDTRKMILLE